MEVSNTRQCNRCGQVKELTQFSKDRTRGGYKCRCKECISVITRLDRLENPEKYLLAELRSRCFNRESIRESNRRYKKNNPDKINANNSKRRSRELKALVPWRNDTIINGIYYEAKRLEMETGIKYHVDHIYPLISDWVCGLHCEFNLRVITWIENLQKGNRRKSYH